MRMAEKKKEIRQIGQRASRFARPQTPRCASYIISPWRGPSYTAAYSLAILACMEDPIWGEVGFCSRTLGKKDRKGLVLFPTLG